jgi:hypothetical protein
MTEAGVHIVADGWLALFPGAIRYHRKLADFLCGDGAPTLRANSCARRMPSLGGLP